MTTGGMETYMMSQQEDNQELPLERAQQSLLIAGDPHGTFTPLNQAAYERNPEHMIVLGDFGLATSFEAALHAAVTTTNVSWIHGNHDVDQEAEYDALFEGSYAANSLHGRVSTLSGIRVAGLGGHFQGSVWHPDTGVKWATREMFVKHMGKGNRWRGGLPLKKRAAIWWEDYQSLWDQRADVLVSHEAPACHPHGHAAIDELAEAMGAKLIIHGHVHCSYTFDYADRDLRVIGVGIAGVSDASGAVIVPGEQDEHRGAILRSAMEQRDDLPNGTLVVQGGTHHRAGGMRCSACAP